MILYKYLSESSAMKVLEGNSIGFSQPKHFNDPFETLAAYPPEGDNELERFVSTMRSEVKRSVWADSSAALCMTRTPRNPLMWAHYSDQHRGMVVGIDSVAAGFTDEARNLIPAQFGGILYTGTRPNQPLAGGYSGDPISVGHTHYYPRGHEEKLARLFLQKPAYWSYEEEVRVVKCISEIENEGNSPSGHFEIIEVDQRELFLLALPKGSIKEVCLGLRHPALTSKETFGAYQAKIQGLQPEAEISFCRQSADTWEFELGSL